MDFGIRVDLHVRHPANEIVVPPLDSHLIVINLTTGVRVQQRRLGENHEHTTAPFEMMLCPAGSEAFWAQNQESDLIQIFVKRKSALSAILAAGFEETPRLDLANRFCFQDAQLWNWALRLRQIASSATSLRLAEMEANTAPLHSLIAESRLTAEQSVRHTERMTKRDIQALRGMSLSCLRQVRVSDLAFYMGFQIDYFSRSFHKATGIRPVEFLAQLRADEALRLIRKSNWTLARIADSCGYADQSHMTRAISGWLSESPARLRRRARAEIFKTL